MVKVIENPSVIKEDGSSDKKILEFVGNVNTKTKELSIAKISHPQGWSESGQTPEFDEYTVVLKGTLRIETKDKTFDLEPDQTIVIEKHTWVRHSTPHEDGAEYIAVCLPAFSLNIANRDK